MSLSEHSRKRIPRIIEGLLKGETHEQIAKACGIQNRRTIERDIEAWRESGGLERFLQTEWLRMHGKIKTMDPVEAHRQLTRLLGRTMTQKIKAEVEHGQITIKMWQPQKEKEKNADSQE